MLNIFQRLLELGVTGAVAAMAAYGAFQFLAKKWIDARFAERLEKFRHDQNQELEHLRYRINALMDRTIKLHQHEFEVLPEVWNKLGADFANIMNFALRFKMYPDLESMDLTEFSELIETSEVTGRQKDELQRVPNADRQKLYLRFIFLRDLQKAKDSDRDFQRYFVSKGIFIQPELKRKIDALAQMMYDALREREIEEQHPMSREGQYAKCDLLRNEGPGRFQEIERDIQARLWEQTS